MKINHYLLNNLKLDESNTFKQGSIFKGKIIDIFGSKALIDVKGKNIIPATLDSDVKVSIGDELSFQVKSFNKSEIMIRIMNNDDIQQLATSNKDNSDKSISNLLKDMNINENQLSIDVVKNLIKGKVPLNKENINDSIKILGKLIQLDSIADNERIILLNPTKSESDIKSTKTLNSNASTSEKMENTNDENNQNTSNRQVNEFKSDLKFDLNYVNKNNDGIEKTISLKSDIKNILLIKDDVNFDGKDITNNIKAVLSENTGINLKEGLSKLITFFIKNDIKLNLNNILNMQELNQHPELFTDKLNKLQTMLKKELGDKTFNNIFISKEIFNENNVDDIKSQTFEIEKIIEKVKSQGKLNIDKEIIEFKNKNDFLNDINKNLLFTLIPITNNKYNLNGIVNFIKKNNKKVNKDKTNVFINLNTYNVGNVKISCSFTGKNISIKMGIEKQHLDLFKENERVLIKKINDLGYKVKSIHYALEDGLDIIDTINSSPNSNPTYYLDIKV